MHLIVYIYTKLKGLTEMGQMIHKATFISVCKKNPKNPDIHALWLCKLKPSEKNCRSIQSNKWYLHGANHRTLFPQILSTSQNVIP